MAVARRVPFVLLFLLLAAVGVALHTGRELRRVELQSRATTQSLESARLSIRERDSMLAQRTARVDTVTVPVVRYVVVRDSARVASIAPRNDTEAIALASRS